jgi:hypothetical protein
MEVLSNNGKIFTCGRYYSTINSAVRNHICSSDKWSWNLSITKFMGLKSDKGLKLFISVHVILWLFDALSKVSLVLEEIG